MASGSASRAASAVRPRWRLSTHKPINHLAGLPQIHPISLHKQPFLAAFCQFCQGIGRAALADISSRDKCYLVEMIRDAIVSCSRLSTGRLHTLANRPYYFLQIVRLFCQIISQRAHHLVGIFFIDQCPARLIQRPNWRLRAAKGHAGQEWKDRRGCHR